MEISKHDCVIVLKSDGTFESAMPDVNEFEGSQVPEHLMNCAAILYALREPKILQYLQNSFYNNLNNIAKEAK